MGLLDEIKNILKTAGAQLTASSKPGTKPYTPTSDMYFTANFTQKAQEWGLSEKDALDVYYHGQERKPGQRCRKYNGYELCISYGQNSTTGQPYISTIWKRDRR